LANDEKRWYRRLFKTAHKILLERSMAEPLANLTGDVLVIGAGFEPYRDILVAAKSVHLTDIDDVNEDIDQVMDAHEITFDCETFDAVVAIEVFEHLRQPSVAASEVLRILRPGGCALISIPFLFRVHGDPYDYQRLTSSGLEVLFGEFSSVTIEGFGGRSHVISDIITTAWRGLVPLRILNHVFAARMMSLKASQDCPSGFIVKLVK